jgi:hypothetical protein
VLHTDLKRQDHLLLHHLRLDDVELADGEYRYCLGVCSLLFEISQEPVSKTLQYQRAKHPHRVLQNIICSRGCLKELHSYTIISTLIGKSARETVLTGEII